MFAKLRQALSSPRADGWIVALATALVLPSVAAGWAADDHLHRMILRGSTEIEGFRRSTLDLFRFASPEHNRALIDEGVFPWWADPEVRFAFFRPLSSLTHWLDSRLWPDSAALAHAHCIAWHAAALLSLRVLYRRTISSGWVAALALALYALDDTRGAPVAWIANRNALVACTVSVWALVAHHRARADGWAPGRWLSPALLLLGMLAGEGAIAICGYLFAYALFADRGDPLGRALSLVPHIAVVGLGAAAVRSMGYGVEGSRVYLDPLGQTAEFLSLLPERWLVLVFAQLGGPWSEGWNAYGFVWPPLQWIVLGAAVATLGLVGTVLAPLLRESAMARFWCAGALLAVVPSCAAFPADRLLPWVGIGAMATLALFFARVAEGRSGGTDPAGRVPLSHAMAVAVVGLHLVIAPLALPMRAMGIAQIRKALERADATIPSDPSIRDKTLIYVNPPADPFASFMPITRADLGIPRPARQRWLATAVGAVEVTRVDDRSLRVTPDGGFMLTPSEQLLRGTGSPLGIGARVATDGMSVEVLEVTADGRPHTALVRFDRRLENDAYVWLVWRDVGYHRFVPPRPGETRVIPAADLVAVAYGADSPVTKLLQRGEAAPREPSAAP